jgi:predicted nuclease of predicted toxin-antitoxin system
VKLLLDQNLSPRLVSALGDIYPGSLHVQNVNLDKADDRDVWDFARIENLIIMTKDVDFSERSIIFGFPPKIVWIRRGNCSTKDIEKILRNNLEGIKRFSENENAGILVLF